MNNNQKIVIKPGAYLEQQELEAINKAKYREWNIPEMERTHQLESTFILLKNVRNEILAQAQLIAVNNVLFDKEVFNIIGIGGIIANVKRQGYGTQVMQAIKEYVIAHKKSVVGFTRVPNFYQKCGYSIDNTALQRFVHIVDNKKITNTTDPYIVYLDSEDEFMQKVLENPNQQIYLPRDPNW